MKSYVMTDIGRVRRVNQDYLFASDESVGNLPNLFIVADGMGGHNAGDYASRCAVETAVQSVIENREFNPVKILQTAIQKANQNVYAQSMEKEELRGMGTTMVAVTILGKYAYVANIGDSRLYVISDNIHQITIDHSLVGEMIRMGQLTEEEGRLHPDKNIITRALGTEGQVKADFFDIRLEEGNRLLLCSDGLSNMLRNEEICRIVLTCGENQDPARLLVNRANENGGKDNIAVIVIEPFTDEVNI